MKKETYITPCLRIVAIRPHGLLLQNFSRLDSNADLQLQDQDTPDMSDDDNRVKSYSVWDDDWNKQ